jgi:hypothetical protein
MVKYQSERKGLRMASDRRQQARHGMMTLAGILICLTIAGCQSRMAGQDAPATIEAYIQALLERDLNKAVNLSCASWEEQARVEYNSFEAVKSTIEGLACEDAGGEADATLVKCEGVIIANYGAEDLRIDLAGRTYQLKQEAGEWRMCGYP